MINFYFRIISVLDPGYSQFYGLTLYDKAAALWVLHCYKQLTENITSNDKQVANNNNNNDEHTLTALSHDYIKEMLSTLETCIKCLRIEPENSHSGKVCERASQVIQKIVNKT